MDIRLSPKLDFFAVERSVRRRSGPREPPLCDSSPSETVQPI
jgi:hypothetical protein